MQLYLRPTCKRYAEAVVVGLEAEPDNLAAQPFPVLLVVQVIVLGGLVLSGSPISRLLEERTHVAHLCLGLAVRYTVHTGWEAQSWTAFGGPDAATIGRLRAIRQINYIYAMVQSSRGMGGLPGLPPDHLSELCAGQRIFPRASAIAKTWFSM
jgi:hypothetical protein